MCINCGKLREQVVHMNCAEVEKQLKPWNERGHLSLLIHISSQLSTRFPHLHTHKAGGLSTPWKPESRSRHGYHCPVIHASTITTTYFE